MSPSVRPSSVGRFVYLFFFLTGQDVSLLCSYCVIPLIGWSAYIIQGVSKNSQKFATSPSHSAAIGCTKNYQPIGVTVHSHWELWNSLTAMYRWGRGCSELWKNTMFLEHPVGQVSCPNGSCIPIGKSLLSELKSWGIRKKPKKPYYRKGFRKKSTADEKTKE